MNRKSFIILVALFIICLTFNTFAMTEKINNEFVPPSPETAVKHEERSLIDRWTWLNDEQCVQFRGSENGKRASIQRMADMGLLRRWAETTVGEWKMKTRDTYTGAWNQDEAGIWSFTFDDYTIPVGVTKIDGVLYAFNTYGELKDGYNYWGDLKTAADGLVVSEDAEFLKYLETEYLPECTSHE